MVESRRLAWPAYLVSFTLVAIPLFDAAMSVAPPRFHDPHWRFGAVGLFSNAAMLPVLGLLVGLAAALLLEHQAARRLIGAISLIAAALSVVAFALLLLDALQTRADVRPDLRTSFAVATATAMAKTILAAVTLSALGAAGLRRQRLSAAIAPVVNAAPPLVVAASGRTTP